MFTIRDSKGQGNAALYVRVRGAAAQFWSFSAKAWQSAEDAGCQVFLAEYPDSDPYSSLYQGDAALPEGVTVSEYVQASTGAVIAEEENSVPVIAGMVSMAPAPAVGSVGDVFPNAGDVIARAAAQLGLGRPDGSPFDSTDPNIQQLCELLVTAGDDVLRAHEWVHLKRQLMFQTVAGQSLYSLPRDFRTLVPDTAWNLTSYLPLGGPLTSQQWSFLQARKLAGLPLRLPFRITPLGLEIQGAPDGATIQLEYLSSLWVNDDATQGAGTKAAPTLASDVLLFDQLLLVRGLKLQFLQAKGFDTTAAVAEYDRTLANEIARTQGATNLSLHRRSFGLRLLDETNLPDLAA